MKINIIIMRICGGIVVLCLVALICIENADITYTLCSIVQNIIIGLLSGSIISFALSLANYWNARSVMINKIFKNSKELYINIKVLSEVIGQTLEQSNFVNIKNLRFSYITSLSNTNLSFISNMDLEDFYLFYHSGELNNIFDKLKSILTKLYIIKNVSSDLEGQALKYQLNIFQQQVDNKQLQNTDLIKNTIIIKMAKLHEYVTTTAINFEEILKAFCGNTQSYTSWDSLKKSLDDTTLSITNKYRMSFY